MICMGLKRFINFLDRNKLIDKSRITKKKGFNDRLRVQKYMFIARYLGLKCPYKFRTGIIGIYSKDLSHDYYNLDAAKGYNDNWNKFNKKGFLETVKGRDEWWLDIAADIVKMGGRQDMIYDVWAYRVTEDYDEEYVKEVYEDLKKTVIVKTFDKNEEYFEYE